MKNNLLHDFKQMSINQRLELVSHHLENDPTVRDYAQALKHKAVLEVFNKGETLFTYGEKNNGLFLIVKGQILLLNLIVPREQKNEEKRNLIKNLIHFEQSVHKQEGNKKEFLLSVQINKRNQGIENKKIVSLFEIKELLHKLNLFDLQKIGTIYSHDGNPKVRVLKTLVNGTVGEDQSLSGLMDNRKSTAICSQNCLVIHIYPSQFKLIFSAKILNTISNKNQIFSKLLKDVCNMRIIQEFITIWTYRTFNKNDVIFKERQYPEFVYFIAQGNVQLQKNCEGGSVLKRKNNKIIRISILGQGEILSDDELIVKQPYFTTARIQSQSAVLYQTTAKQFMKMMKSYLTLKTFFHQMCEKKRQNREVIYQRLQKTSLKQKYQSDPNIDSVTSLRYQTDPTNKIRSVKKSLNFLPELTKINLPNRKKIRQSQPNIKSLQLKIPDRFKMSRSKKQLEKSTDRQKTYKTQQPSLISSPSLMQQTPQISKLVYDLYYHIGEIPESPIRNSHRKWTRKE